MPLHSLFNFHLLKIHLTTTTLATLQRIIHKTTTILITIILFQAVKVHVLILRTRIIAKIYMLIHGLYVLNLGRLFITSAKTIGYSTNGTMGNGGSSTKCHTLRNGATDTR